MYAPNIDCNFFSLLLCLYFKETALSGVSGDYRKYSQVLTVSLQTPVCLLIYTLLRMRVTNCRFECLTEPRAGKGSSPAPIYVSTLSTLRGPICITFLCVRKEIAVVGNGASRFIILIAPNKLIYSLVQKSKNIACVLAYTVKRCFASFQCEV